ncbi:hypothetical protein IFM60648_04278 [Aspergillus lentulus]|uniref:Uncharacterized protein n=1 Tax=Aspergillus lentulus TaxID=293939 RepID=A0ABQ1A6L5_ASPLE|nr:hypothetical protein IFM60648_04278 [Aspergillus lentulus]
MIPNPSGMTALVVLVDGVCTVRHITLRVSPLPVAVDDRMDPYSYPLLGTKLSHRAVIEGNTVERKGDSEQTQREDWHDPTNEPEVG